MQWKYLISCALATSQVNALLRFAFSQLVVERFDPLVSPGQVSSHLHQVVGGNAYVFLFNITMDPANDLPSLSTCTTCTYKEDLSNYWTAVLYFQHPNGAFKRVPQLPGQYLGNANGGMIVYYIQTGGAVTAFKKGFRMLVGNPWLRTFNSSSAEANSLNFRCLTANYGNSGVTGAPGTDSHELPNQICTGGIRSQIIFPTCWDGVNLDTADHKSHVSYTINGACPSTHPVSFPELFIETIWDTTSFNSMWPSGGKQPFVFSMGDSVGVGQHADYVFGWKGNSLQQAMNSCTDAGGGNCNVLTTQSIDTINSCTQASRGAEQTEGWIPTLPGCNPIQAGPATATPVSGCGAVTTAAPGTYPPVTPVQPGSTVITSTETAIPTQAPGGTAAHWGQCGGQGWFGPTVCASPYTCKVSNAYYSQCL
ncbi:carbohydrate-binding module family 1 protein [Hypholoma sublateritium FD-334 SS-4]|uniref:Carbohydrate-binding module family 1 protein n=1 Tax=Hypholoma sublateritium (strain FD-334 SS-4) TaxID=945553 RepID=A0A0D2PK53_HYPSF|nr:carbohydrate-binding module family 1 protein [Hypholoma sublateritium FD-334 SS-4]